MMDYIDRNSYTISTLLQLANMEANDADALILEDLTLQVQVGMYCSPGLNLQHNQ